MITIKNLKSGYGKIQIIRDISMEINDGEIVAIMGRNGVGKTTLMKTIMGVIRPMDGSIVIDGKDFTKLPVFRRAKDAGIGYVEQGHGIFADLTVEENLKIGLRINNNLKNEDFSKVYEYFPILGERKKQRSGTLSGGEQAMLSIARVLVADPKVIILDEPSEGVQPNVVTQMASILQKINTEMGKTIVLVEQHIKMIQSISGRGYAIDKGVIVGELSKEELSNDSIISSYLSV